MGARGSTLEISKAAVACDFAVAVTPAVLDSLQVLLSLVGGPQRKVGCANTANARWADD